MADPESTTKKTCSKCEELKSIDAFGKTRGLVKAHCKECHRAWQVAYSATNRERIAEAAKLARQIDPRGRTAIYRRSYLKHQAKKLKYAAAYRAAHPGVFVAYRASEHGKTIDAKYRAATRDVQRSIQRRYQHRRRSWMRNVMVEDVDHLAVFKRDGWQCGICSEPVAREDASLDHVVPLSRGGEHSYANVQCAHLLCNIRKGAKRQEPAA